MFYVFFKKIEIDDEPAPEFMEKLWNRRKFMKIVGNPFNSWDFSSSQHVGSESDWVNDESDESTTK